MRYARIVISIVCTLLCLAAVGVWVRGYFVSDTIGFGRSHPDGKGWAAGVMHGRGGVGVAFVRGIPYQPPVGGYFHDRQPPRYGGETAVEPATVEGLGFRWISIAPSSPPLRGWALTVPLWFLLLVFAAWPAWQVRKIWRGRAERRRRLGLCLRCGYDLRASADRCPECGEPKPAASPAAAPAAAVLTAPDV